MKEDSEVQQRIRTLLTEGFERRVALAEARLPGSCVFNHRQPLDLRKRVDGENNVGFNRITRGGHGALPVVQTIGLCMYGAEDPAHWPGTICEDPVDAKRCPPQAFTPKASRDSIKEEFEAQIRDISWVKVNLPEVYALLWALGTETIPAPTPPTEEAGQEVTLVTLSRWAKLLLWLAGLGRRDVLVVEKNNGVRSTGADSQS